MNDSRYCQRTGEPRARHDGHCPHCGHLVLGLDDRIAGKRIRPSDAGGMFMEHVCQHCDASLRVEVIVDYALHPITWD